MRVKNYHTIETLMKRTEEVGECIEWQGYFQNKVPFVQHGERFLSVRRLILELNGTDVPADMYAKTSCGNPMCVNPSHIVLVSKKQHSKAMAAKVKHNSPTRLAKLVKSAQSRRVLTDDQVMQALMDDRTCAEIAKEFEVSKSLISKIRRGQSNRMVKAMNNPFSGLMRI
jgi:hypothetical protein